MNAHYNTLQFVASTKQDRLSERTLLVEHPSCKGMAQVCHCIAEDENGQAAMSGIQLQMYAAPRCWIAVMHFV